MDTRKAYTVVVRLIDSLPHFRTFQVYATDPHMAGAVAVDAFIEADGNISTEDDGEDPDRFRVNYECVAIFEGHHTDLIQ